MATISNRNLVFKLIMDKTICAVDIFFEKIIDTILGCSSLIDKHLHLHFVFTIFWQKKNGKHQCENGFFWMSFGCLLDLFWVSFGLLDGYNTGG